MYRSLEEICEAAEGSSFYEAVLADDCKERGIKEVESKAQMRAMYEAMKQADAGYEAKRVSASGLAGTDGEKLAQARTQKKLICGDLIGLVMEKAVKMGESNACMKRIVAAPTAGSCGVLPAVLLSLEEMEHYPTEQLVEALYVAAGIGGVIADVHCRSGRRLSGGDRFRVCHGGGGCDLASRRGRSADHPRGGAGTKKPAWTCL